MIKGPDRREMTLDFMNLFNTWIQGSANDTERQVFEGTVYLVKSELASRKETFSRLFDKRSGRLGPRLPRPAPEVHLGKCRCLWTAEFSVLDVPAEEIARQLTAWLTTRFSAIGRVELLDCAWDKLRLQARAPSVIALAQHYKPLSQLVGWSAFVNHATEKLETKLNSRLERLEQWIEIANAIFEARNYFDSAAAISGFHANPMFRVKGHFDGISQNSKETLHFLKRRFFAVNNFKELRLLYDRALTEQAAIIPCIGF
jgi:hypothetical protein